MQQVEKLSPPYTLWCYCRFAKSLRDLHKGGYDPEVLKKLQTLADLTLRVTKVTASSLGRAMSTLVVQECKLWLCLVDMRDADKVWFLKVPVSQTSLFGNAGPGYMHKVLATPFRDQVVSLQALPPDEADPALTLLCSFLALRWYVDRTQSFSTSEHRQTGNAIYKQRMAHWIVDAITMAYKGIV